MTSLLEAIHKQVRRPLRILNVCGGHELSFNRYGLRSLLPSQLQMIPGPGCPVCVCPQEILQQAIDVAMRPQHCLISFSDMLRVPISRRVHGARSLEEIRARGGRVHGVTSPGEVLQYCRDNPAQQCVFLAVGFETTAAPVAAMLSQSPPDNLRLISACRRTLPVVSHMLTNEGLSTYDAILAPGHVCSITGADEWQQIVSQFNIPVVVSGFNAEQILAAIYTVLKDVDRQNAHLHNTYSAVVRPQGNQHAREILNNVFALSNARWRGIGEIPQSGFELNEQHAHFRYDIDSRKSDVKVREFPASCECADVMLGKIQPADCKLFGRGCSPEVPTGPCMVSAEGACQIWWMHAQEQVVDA